MLTGTQAADVLSLVQTSVVAALGADAWLAEGGTGGIAGIATRALPSESMSYRADELPALVVSADGISARHGRGTFGSYDQEVRCSVEYVSRAADLADGMADARETLARLARWLHEEVHTSGRRLDGLLDDADGAVTESDGKLSFAAGRNYVVRSELRFTLTLRMEI